MVPPQVMAEAAEAHDEAVLSTLSLLMHPSDPLSLEALTTLMRETPSLSLEPKPSCPPQQEGSA
jgi:hypothetical protein